MRIRSELEILQPHKALDETRYEFSDAESERRVFDRDLFENNLAAEKKARMIVSDVAKKNEPYNISESQVCLETSKSIQIEILPKPYEKGVWWNELREIIESLPLEHEKESDFSLEETTMQILRKLARSAPHQSLFL